jgi:MFS family permease
MLALGAFMVPAGRVGDIFGRRRALLAGIALFGISSALCALAPSATLVIAFGALRGLGAALIFPVSVSVLTNAFPSVHASHAIGLAYGIAGLGNAAGPLIGGLLTETVGWRWIFWLNIPLALVAGHRSAQHHRILRRNRAAPHRRHRAGAHHSRDWLVHVDI